MKCLAFVLLFATASLCQGAGEELAKLKDAAKLIGKGQAEGLEAFHDIQSEDAARLVLELIQSSRVGGGLKARAAEVVAGWSALAPGRKTLLDWLEKHPRCDDNTLLFYAQVHFPETRSYFWRLIDSEEQPVLSKEPSHPAMAVLALGHFADNPEIVVTRIGSFLADDYPHVLRATAADALGGMRHVKAVEALIPHLEDVAIGERAARSLYRLTGQHFSQEPAARWRAWLQQADGKIDFKMLSAAEYDGFLKMEAMVKPDDTQVNTFYGLDIRGKGLLFILDVSGSMNQEDRISKLRGQMQNILVVLQSRSPKTKYGILTFGENLDTCFPRGVMENTEENHRRAERFVEGLQADGGTPMMLALTHALNKVLPGADIDTIYFLSDGQPGDGTPEMVLDLTRKIFQRFQVRFNTVSIGEEAPAAAKLSLLQEMAQITGGQFAQPK